MTATNVTLFQFKYAGARMEAVTHLDSVFCMCMSIILKLFSLLRSRGSPVRRMLSAYKANIKLLFVFILGQRWLRASIVPGLYGYLPFYRNLKLFWTVVAQRAIDQFWMIYCAVQHHKVTVRSTCKRLRQLFPSHWDFFLYVINSF